MSAGITKNSKEDGMSGRRCLGIDRQCVEYARRWLYVNRGFLYEDVTIAADIWDKVKFYTRVVDEKSVAVFNIENGANQLPDSGDLIIYSEKYLNTGHVAVVANIDTENNFVHVYEQNYANECELPKQKRKIPYVYHTKKYWLLDSYLLGWKSLIRT